MMRMENELLELQKMLREAADIMLICHVSPDGDTLGSALALCMRLERMGKSVTLGVDGDVPESYRFLPHWQRLARPEALKPRELAVCVDLSDEARMGAMAALFSASAHTALIDHHPTNTRFAELNLVDGDAPATAVLIWRLMKLEGSPITEDEAICLYTALSTDTGNFIYESTNAESFAMMGELMAAGLNLSHYSRMLFRQKSLLFERLLGKALGTLEISADGHIAGLCVSSEMLRELQATAEHTDGIIDYAIDLENVQLAYFLREEENGRVKASLRALAPYRVDNIALGFGGGGHRLAAGCTLQMPLADARDAIERAFTEALEEQ